MPPCFKCLRFIKLYQELVCKMSQINPNIRSYNPSQDAPRQSSMCLVSTIRLICAILAIKASCSILVNYNDLTVAPRIMVNAQGNRPGKKPNISFSPENPQSIFIPLNLHLEQPFPRILGGFPELRNTNSNSFQNVASNHN